MSENYRIVEWNKTFRVQKKTKEVTTTGSLWWKKTKVTTFWDDLTEDGKSTLQYACSYRNIYRERVPYKTYDSLYDAKLAAQIFEKGETIHEV
jgi:hypothetical protein